MVPEMQTIPVETGKMRFEKQVVPGREAFTRFLMAQTGVCYHNDTVDKVMNLVDDRADCSCSSASSYNSETVPIFEVNDVRKFA